MTAQVNANTQHCWWIMSQALLQIPPNSEERVTEEGFLRVTEEDQQRVTEGT